GLGVELRLLARHVDALDGGLLHTRPERFQRLRTRLAEHVGRRRDALMRPRAAGRIDRGNRIVLQRMAVHQVAVPLDGVAPYSVWYLAQPPPTEEAPDNSVPNAPTGAASASCVL